LTPPEPATDLADVAEGVLGEIVERNHLLHPDELVPLAEEVLARLGADEVTVCAVDYDQTTLVPLVSDPAVAVEAYNVDSTLPGRAYRTSTVVEGDADGRRRLWLPMLDGAERAGVLGVTVTAVDAALVRHLKHVAALLGELVVSKRSYGDTLERARRTRAMDLAAELRWSLLPPLTFACPAVAIAGILQPAYLIAGDAFDYGVSGDTAHLAILDAMGHGLEASRIASLAVCAYRNARRRGQTLLETYRFADEVVADQFGDERFVTGQLAQLDLPSGALQWVSAGHPRPLLVRSRKVVGEIPATSSLPLGLGDVAAEIADTALEPGDRVLFYTDGVVEAHNEAGEEYGLDRLADMIGRAEAGEEAVAETVRRLSQSVLTHQGTDLRDDATVLLVEWPGPGSQPAV